MPSACQPRPMASSHRPLPRRLVMSPPALRERHVAQQERVMTDFDFSESYSHAGGGDVQLEFVDSPALTGEDVEWTFRTVGGQTAPAGTVAAQSAVMSHDHNIRGGGK